MELRDNAVELRYAWLKFVVKQRLNVAILAVVGMIALICLTFLSSPQNQLLVSALAGWLGGCFAANLTIANIPIDENLPDSTAVGVRTVFGSVFAVAGFCFWRAGILTSVLLPDSLWSVIAVAFAFGVAGERVLPSLIGSSIGKSSK